jgi:hypothetical protein
MKRYGDTAGIDRCVRKIVSVSCTWTEYATIPQILDVAVLYSADICAQCLLCEW